jgi:hypothetical protein
VDEECQPLFDGSGSDTAPAPGPAAVRRKLLFSPSIIIELAVYSVLPAWGPVKQGANVRPVENMMFFLIPSSLQNILRVAMDSSVWQLVRFRDCAPYLM